MKKLNRKGFTLVELLAVIVVLAIIMVIATQQVNNTIKKSRGNSLYATVEVVQKAARTVCAQETAPTLNDLKEQLDYADVDITVSNSTITVSPSTNGKFSNGTYPAGKGKISAQKTGETYNGTYIITADCNFSS